MKRQRKKNAWYGFKRLFTPNRKPTATLHVGPGPQEKAAPVPVPENFQTQSVYDQAKIVRDTVHLEGLPAEIRRHILSMLKYDELKALVHVSPVYHQ